MNTLAFNKTEISNLLIGSNLQQTEELLQIAHKKGFRNNRSARKSLAGIWGKTNPADLENDLNELRKTLQSNLDEKSL